ncbi:hypothetical protein IWQ60_002895 [Tieghemiomyces parasiticus]|uniref:NADH dehydrogenase [ubiquinone] 1 beta subcomplex subunit 4 n=1 Tax=Tieghemiomyces parasiticus TaxID=78921 RepID=A0A9W8AEA0_9FUNG|nr:hypothetical protein IWQ60_002895 [Tieghemiomyces parasiticus]
MGSGPELLKHDPAIEKWVEMREAQHLNFRPTARNTRLGLLVYIAIPVIGYFVTAKTTNRWDFFLSREGEPLLKEERQKAIAAAAAKQE